MNDMIPPEDLGAPIDEVNNKKVNRNVPVDEQVLGQELPKVRSSQEMIDAQVISIQESFKDPDTIRNQLVSNSVTSMVNIIEEMRVAGEEADLKRVRYSEEQSKLLMQDMENNPTFIYEQAAAILGKDADPMDVRGVTNLEIARRKVKELRDRESSDSMIGGAVDMVVDFGAMILRESTIGIPENLTSRTIKKGQEISLNRYGMPPEEFKSWFDEYAESVYQEGLGSGNAWQIDQLESELEGMGTDAWDNAKKVFAVVDIIGLGKPVSLAAKAGLRSSTRLSRSLFDKSTKVRKVAIVEGVEAANEKGAALAKAGDPEAAADMGPVSMNPSGMAKDSVNATEGFLTRQKQKETLIKDVDKQAPREAQRNPLALKIDEASKAGSAPRVLDKGELAEASIQAKKFLGNFDAKVGNRVLNVIAKESGLGRFQTVARLGMDDNNPFKAVGKNMSPPAQAEKLASRLNDNGFPSQVVPVNINDLSQGYVIELKQNIKVGNVLGFKKTDLMIADKISRIGIGRALETIGLGRVLSSSSWRDNETIQALGYWGEQGNKALLKIVNDHIKPYEKLSYDDKMSVNLVIDKYRNGEHAARRTRYSDSEFQHEFSKVSTKPFEPKHLEAYHAISDLEDTAWTLGANELLMKYVDRGFKGVEVNDGIILPGKRVGDIDGIGSQVKIADIDSGIDITKDRLGANDVVFKLDKPWVSNAGESVEYVTKTKRVTELEPEDVLGYNPGGTRMDQDAPYFVVSKIGNRSKVLISARTPKQAEKAKGEIGNLLRAGDNLTDDMVKGNNTWRPELETVAGFRAWMKTNKVDPNTRDLFRKERDQSITIGDEYITDGNPHVGGHFGDWLSNDLRREDRVLDQFGGGKVLNADPVAAIAHQFDGRLQQHSMRAYTLRSQIEWVKTAERKGKSEWFPPELRDSNDYYMKFANAKITGKDEFDIRMRELQDTYKRRMGEIGPVSNFFDEMGTKIQEYVLDKGFKNTSDMIKDPNITNKMLGLGFQSAFGFLNVGQLFLQASHAATVTAAVATKSDPLLGVKASSLALTTRAILATTDLEVYKGLRKNLSKAYDISEDQVEQLIQLQKVTGRGEVGSEIAENATGNAFGLASFNGDSMLPSQLRKALTVSKEAGGKVLDVGIAPFNMGERFAARTSLYAASLEYLKANTKANLLSQEAMAAILKRDQDLSFAMSNHARSAAQSGMMKMPTQWLSHSLRSMEVVFIGRNFTVAERARMAIAMGPMLGLNGLGITWAADNINEYLGSPIEEDSAFYTTLKWGVYDGVMDALLPEGEGEGKVGIGFSSRMAPVSAFYDLYDKVFGEQTSVAGALAGPSGEITYSAAEAVFGALGSLLTNRPVSLTEDLIKVMRQPSAFDNYFKAAGIIANGTYLSKNGVEIPGKFTSAEASLMLLGIGSLKQQEWYDIRGQVYKSTKKQIAFGKELTSKIDKAHELIFGVNADEDSSRRGAQLINEILVTIQNSNLPPKIQRDMRKKVLKRSADQFPKMLRKLLEQDKMSDMRRLESVMGR
jgi:hypothetical protein